MRCWIYAEQKSVVMTKLGTHKYVTRLLFYWLMVLFGCEEVDKNLVCVCTWNFPLCACVFSAPGETDVLLLTALLSVRPLWRTPVQQTCTARTIQLALRQSLKDPIVRSLSNYGNLINLFSSSPLTAFVSAWDLLRDLCELHPIVGVRDEDSGTALFSRSQLYFKEAPKIQIKPLKAQQECVRFICDFCPQMLKSAIYRVTESHV